MKSDMISKIKWFVYDLNAVLPNCKILIKLLKANNILNSIIQQMKSAMTLYVYQRVSLRRLMLVLIHEKKIRRDRDL